LFYIKIIFCALAYQLNIQELTLNFPTSQKTCRPMTDITTEEVENA